MVDPARPLEGHARGQVLAFRAGAVGRVNEPVVELGKEMLALEDPVPPEFVREFQESTIYYPVPEEFLETVVSESLKLPARVWREADP